MQPSWFTVPWVQFQTYPGMGGMGGMGMNMAAQSMNPNPMATMPGVNPLGGVNGLNGVNGIPTLNGINLSGLNGLGLNGLGHTGALMAMQGHPAPAAPSSPALALQIRRAHQTGPPPLSALIRGKKDPDLVYRKDKRKAEDEVSDNQDIKKAKIETKALKAKRPGFSEERYNETSYYIENGLRKVYPYYFTFTTFTKGRWVAEKIIDVFAKEFRAHPAEEYERCIKSGTLTVNYEKVDTDYRLKHNDLLANIVHRHEVPVTADAVPLVHVDEDLVVVDKPASIPVHPCGRYRHNTVVFILAKEYNLKNLRTIHRLDRLTSGLLLFGRTPKKAREIEVQIRTRQVRKEYVCRVEGEFPTTPIDCNEPIEVVSYKIGVCKVAPNGKDCKTEFQRLSYNGKTSVVVCRPYTGRMHQIRVHLQYLGFPIVNDPLYNHTVFGPEKGKGGIVDKSDEQLIQDLIKIHNAENWLGMDGDSEYSMFKPLKEGGEDEGVSQRSTPSPKEKSPPAPSSPRIVSPPCITSRGAAAAYHAEITAPSSPLSREDPQDYMRMSNGATPEDILKGSLEANPRDCSFRPHLMTYDPHCYECKVKYRDPKPKDLVMYLHALSYSGPGWSYKTQLPEWATDS